MSYNERRRLHFNKKWTIKQIELCSFVVLWQPPASAAEEGSGGGEPTKVLSVDGAFVYFFKLSVGSDLGQQSLARPANIRESIFANPIKYLTLQNQSIKLRRRQSVQLSGTRRPTYSPPPHPHPQPHPWCYYGIKNERKRWMISKLEPSIDLFIIWA